MQYRSRYVLLGPAVAAAVVGINTHLSHGAEQFLSPNDFAIAIATIPQTYIDDTGDGGLNSMYPFPNESPQKLIDGSITTKYLNFGRLGAGFIVEPGTSTVQSFQLSTANDSVNRDPTRYVLLGTNDPIQSQDRSTGLGGETWHVIQSGTLALPDTRNTAGPIVNVTNGTTYSSYKMYFPTLKGPDANSVQISEAQFFSAPAGGGSPVLSSGNTILAIDNPGSNAFYTAGPASAGGQGPQNAIDQIIDGSHKHRNQSVGGGLDQTPDGAGLILTPKRGPSVIHEFRIATGNNVVQRDPTSYQIYGTNDAIQSYDEGDGNGGENWTLIGSGSLSLPAARDTISDPIALTNSTAYTSYKVVFPTNGWTTTQAGDNGTQLDEIMFNGDLTGATEWLPNASENWQNHNNWFGPFQNGVGATNRFLNRSTAPHTVFTDAPVTLGTLVINNGFTYELTGSSTLTMQVATGNASISVGGATHKINLPLTIASNTTIDVAAGATLKISDPVTVNAGKSITQTGAGAVVYESTVDVLTGGGLEIRSGGSHMTGLNLDAHASATFSTGSGSAARADALSVNHTATIDMTNSDLVTSTDQAAVQAMVNSGRNGGAWNGTGMTSTAAARQVSHATTLGVMSGAEYNSVGGTGNFSGQAYAANDTLVKYTWYGDSDFNGIVSFDDYARLDAGFNNHQTGWSHGDFDGNNTVNFDDYVLADLAFNSQSGTLNRALSFLDGTDRSSNGMNGAALQRVVRDFNQFGDNYASHLLAAVPEPTSIGLLGCVVGAALSRRRRHR